MVQNMMRDQSSFISSITIQHLAIIIECVLEAFYISFQEFVSVHHDPFAVGQRLSGFI